MKKILFDNTVEGFNIYHGKSPFAYFQKHDGDWMFEDHDNEIAVLYREGKEFFLQIEDYEGNMKTEKLKTPFRIEK